MADVVFNGPNGHPKAEEDLRCEELKKLHAARYDVFKKLGGRLPSAMTMIQVSMPLLPIYSLYLVHDRAGKSKNQPS